MEEIEQPEQFERLDGKITPPPRSQLNIISYLLIGLLAVFWPLASFYFLEDQTQLAEEITSPLWDVYLPTIMLQLAVLLVVLIALRSEKAALKDVGLANFNRWTIPLGVLFLVGANIVLWVLQGFLLAHDPEHFSDIVPLLPETTLDKVIWLVLCLVVAVSEEITFRGYLITRVSAIAGGRLWVGILVSTLAFASGHLYQGIGGFILIFVYGLMFAGLYLGSRSLWPGMIAHFLQDAMVLFLPESIQ